MRLRACQGFSLAELLVAAAILAIGMLGAIALVAAGLRLERDAANLATAATLAADLAERIRANHAGGVGYSIDPGDPLESPPPGCDAGLPVDAATRAACDTIEWRQLIAESLPGAAVRVTAITVPGTTAFLYTIDVRWSAWRDVAGGRCSLQLQV